MEPPPSYRPMNVSPDAASRAQQTLILTPAPQPQHVHLLTPPFRFETPKKRITSTSDAKRFVDSESGKSFLGFIVCLSHSIRGRKISDLCPESDTLLSVSSVLDAISSWVDVIAPASQSARYGNPSFRVWHEKVCDSAQGLMLEILPTNDEEIRVSTIELVPYFTDSFGNAQRIDYGTGHEANFVAWLYCLARLGLINEEDYQAVVSRVFVKYLDLMRKLQLVYCLESAGSHGVWGLDDYHFLPFVFGSAQLIDHKYMKPKSIHNENVLENFAKEYLYLSCIVFIKKVKKGPFAEHSPMLDDISGVPNWNKVNSGMLKMYRAEVLEKVPIVQHFLFGSIIKWFFSQPLLLPILLGIEAPVVGIEAKVLGIEARYLSGSDMEHKLDSDHRLGEEKEDTRLQYYVFGKDALITIYFSLIQFSYVFQPSLCHP